MIVKKGRGRPSLGSANSSESRTFPPPRTFSQIHHRRFHHGTGDGWRSSMCSLRFNCSQCSSCRCRYRNARSRRRMLCMYLPFRWPIFREWRYGNGSGPTPRFEGSLVRSGRRGEHLSFWDCCNRLHASLGNRNKSEADGEDVVCESVILFGALHEAVRRHSPCNLESITGVGACKTSSIVQGPSLELR